MTDMLNPAENPGQVADATRPGLRFATGRAGDIPRPLAPGDKHYESAVFAWRHQDSLTDEQRDDFFAALDQEWPRPSGPQREMDAITVVAAWLLHIGIPDDDIPKLLGRYERDTLRRRGVFRRAPLLVKHSQEARPPLPRVYSTDELEAHWDVDPAFYCFDLAADSPRSDSVINLLEDLSRRDPAIYAALRSGVQVDRVRELPASLPKGGTATSLEDVERRRSEWNAAELRATPPALIKLHAEKEGSKRMGTVDPSD